MQYGPYDDDDLRIGQAPAGSPQTARKRRRRWPYVAAAVVVLLAGGGVAAFYVLKPAAPITIVGTLVLNDTDPTVQNFEWDENAPCRGVKGYHDIVEGAQVVVRDASAKVIAVGSLGTGKPGGISDDGLGRISTKCEFPFSVADVPVKDFYGVEVTHRGVVTFSRQQTHGGLTLTIGT